MRVVLIVAGSDGTALREMIALAAGERFTVATPSWSPDGAVILGFFLKPNRFAYGEKFFTAPGER